MKLCLNCHSHIHTQNWHCSQCNYQPKTDKGILKLILDSAKKGAGFDATYFPELAKLEDENFWFQARNALIIWALKKHFPNANSFLEIGCGTGFVLSGIAHSLPNIKIYGSELFIEGLDFASQRLPSAEFFQMDARNIPFKEEFDVIGAFDVIEHIEEDVEVLKQMYEAVCPGGGILLTVPIHRWLWSAQDEYAHHVRRYQIKELRKKVEQAGFMVLRKTAFVSFLLPFMLASRFRKKKFTADTDPLAELKLPKTLNTLFHATMKIEKALIRLGINFPAGGSMLLIAKK